MNLVGECVSRIVLGRSPPRGPAPLPQSSHGHALVHAIAACVAADRGDFTRADTHLSASFTAAAGTGIVTAALVRALPGARIVATDLNQAMLDVAAARIHSSNVEFQAADAQDVMSSCPEGARSDDPWRGPRVPWRRCGRFAT